MRLQGASWAVIPAKTAPVREGPGPLTVSGRPPPQLLWEVMRIEVRPWRKEGPSEEEREDGSVGGAEPSKELLGRRPNYI